MEDRIKTILEEAREKIARADTADVVEQLRVGYLGKKGQITEVFQAMGKLDKEAKKQIGPAANKAKNEAVPGSQEESNNITNAK